MRRYTEPLMFALATLGVQVVVTALLDWMFSSAGLYPSFVKWAAIGLLGVAAGWRGSMLGLLAIVAVDLVWYGAVAVLGSPDTALLDTLRVNVVFLVIAGAGYVAGGWLHRGRTTHGPVTGTPAAR